MTGIDKHMLRPIADKLYEITDEMWNKINSENRDLTKEYLKINKQLSERTIEDIDRTLVASAMS